MAGMIDTPKPAELTAFKNDLRLDPRSLTRRYRRLAEAMTIA
jgi:hypothetical protein